MFNIGDMVVYGSQGVCKIETIQEKQIGKAVMNYFVLKPAFNEKTSLFVPVENATLSSKMQSILTCEQAKSLIDKASSIEVLKYADENRKREQYKSIIAGGNREALVALIKTIVAEREKRCIMGKKLNTNDEQTLYKAETLLYNELAVVYGIEPEKAKNLLVF